MEGDSASFHTETDQQLFSNDDKTSFDASVVLNSPAIQNALDEAYGDNPLSSVENFDESAVNPIPETPSQDVKQPNFEIIFQELNRISCDTSDVEDIKEMIVRLQDKLNNVVLKSTDSCSKDMNAEQLCQLEHTFKKTKTTVSEEHSELDEVVGDESIAGVVDVEENVVDEALSDF